MKNEFILNSLEQVMWARGKPKGETLHIDRKSQYLSIHYLNRFMDVGFKASVGSFADSYVNAMADSINPLYKAEEIHKHRPWRGFEGFER